MLLSVPGRTMLERWMHSGVSISMMSVACYLAFLAGPPVRAAAGSGLEEAGSRQTNVLPLNASYAPPPESAGALAGISFSGQNIGGKFLSRFAECDAHDKCDGKTVKYPCSTDRNENTALMRLKNGVVFFDGKMGVDADGSPYAKAHRDKINQDDTSLRYPLKGDPSLNADRVPFVVIPMGGFAEELGVELGDVVAVIWKSKRVFALIGDAGPPCKIGEGSIALHEALGHAVCLQRSSTGDCEELRDVSIDKHVLYFIFPHTRAQIYPGLTPDNVGQRMESIGAKAWAGLAGE